jgi:hypothetical protein
MRYWQVQANSPGGGQALFGVEAEDREAAAAMALQVIKDVLVPVDLQITELPSPSARRYPAAST